jgi:glyoxylase-like metal-dependent hydrolase (beta-lactamase superfamily II)
MSASETLQFPLGDEPPAMGVTVEVAPGVRWLRMPLPFALDHINLWLLREARDGHDGWTVIDCGIDDEVTRSAWERVFPAELANRPLLRLLVTHFHPDHIGLAHWLAQRWSTPARECPLWTSAETHGAALTGVISDSDVGGEGAARFFRLHGLTDARALGQVRERARHYVRMVPAVPERYTRIADGQVIDIGGRQWRCIASDGHAPGHISFYCEALGLLVSGDMILPRISTNVSVFWRDPQANPLRLYLDSLARLRELPADTLVLPSHGRPFRGLQVRIRELCAHHAQRLAQVRAACGSAPRSAAELLAVLFRRKLDTHQLTFAMGEAIAHLHALRDAGELQAAAGPDGIVRFAPAEHSWEQPTVSG